MDVDSSVELLDEQISADVIGTVRKDSKALPKDVVNSKLNEGGEDRNSLFTPV